MEIHFNPAFYRDPLEATQDADVVRPQENKWHSAMEKLRIPKVGFVDTV
jgi:hypothetical protein